MPLVWNIGSIFGPTLGGALANLKGVKPGQPLPPNAGFLEKFPYALPNLIAALIFVVGIITGILFLEETLAVKRDHRDFGLLLGDRIKKDVRRSIMTIKKKLRHIDHDRKDETEPLLKPSPVTISTFNDEETGAHSKPKETPSAPSIREVLHYQTIMNLIVYTLLALHSMAFDQLIPVFMHHPRQDHSNNPQFAPPLKFAGGFGLQSGRIGLLFTLYGVIGMLVQFFVFPPVARKYGVLRCLRICALVMPFIYFFVPFTALVTDETNQQIVIFLFMIAKGVCTTFAFPSATILLTNSASSLRILGTLNGLATSFGAVGRAIGPAIGGSVFTLGIQKGYIIAPWWLLSAIAVIAAIPTFWLVEGDGFGGDEGNVEDSDDEDEEGHGDTDEDNRLAAEEEEHEEGYGAVHPLLDRTRTTSTSSFTPSEAHGDDYDSEDTTRPRRVSGSLRRKPSRKMSAPIGMSKPIGRKYSTSLGQSFGSAASYHE